MLKRKFPLIMAGVGLVLTFFMTVGKLIDPGSLVLRYAVNIALFFGIGILMEYFYRQFAVPALKSAEEHASDPASLASSETGKGSKVDFTVGGSAETAGQADAQSPAGTAPVPGAPAEEAKPNPLGPHKDFEIQDDFIIINDKKMRNDPKLMAGAIKTKMEE